MTCIIQVFSRTLQKKIALFIVVFHHLVATKE